MTELTDEELKILIFLVQTRLRAESKRKSYIGRLGDDRVAQKVWDLAELREKLESMRMEM